MIYDAERRINLSAFFYFIKFLVRCLVSSEKSTIFVDVLSYDVLISLYRYQAYHCNRYHSSAAIGTARIAVIGTKFIGSA